MKTGIIGLPQVGKTSLFRILTKAHLSDQARANPREAHIGVAKVPDDRLDRLAALYNPKKLTHTSVEYVDVGAIGQEALKDSAYAAHLRNVDALAHVVRAFDDPSVPHTGEIDPLRDIKNVEFDLLVNDLGQIEKRLERLEKDLKKMKTPELEKEFELLKRAKVQVESDKPLREMAMTPEDKKRIKGFMFLSEKPIFYVLDVTQWIDFPRMRDRGIVENPHHVRQRIHVAQMRGVGTVFQRLLADGAYVHVFDGRMREFLRVVKRGQAIEAIVRNLGHADMRLARIGASLIRKMRLGENSKQRCLAHLRQADNAGFHRKLLAVCSWLLTGSSGSQDYRLRCQFQG